MIRRIEIILLAMCPRKMPCYYCFHFVGFFCLFVCCCCLFVFVVVLALFTPHRQRRGHKETDYIRTSISLNCCFVFMCVWISLTINHELLSSFHCIFLELTMPQNSYFKILTKNKNVLLAQQCRLVLANIDPSNNHIDPVFETIVTVN